MSEAQQAEAIQSQHAEPAETGGGESSIEANPGEAVSFSDLEAMETSLERKKELEVKEEVEKQQAVEEAKDESTEEPKEEKKEGKEDAEEKTEAKTEAKTEGLLKTVKMKTVDKDGNEVETDLSFDAKVPVKIDGETKYATVEQLVRNFSGLGNLNKKYEDLKTEKETFQTDLDTINGRIGAIMQTYTKDKDLAMMQLVEAIGGNGSEYVSHFNQKVLETAVKLSELPEHERQIYLANAERDQIRSLHESRIRTETSIRERQTLDRRTRELQTTHGVDDKTFNDIADELLQLRQSGYFNGEITPELIIETAISDRQTNTAKEIITDVVPDKLMDQEFVSTVKTMIQQNPQFTAKEMKEIIAEGLGIKSKAQVLSEKVNTNNKIGGETQKLATNPQNEDLWTFDQFEQFG